MSALKLNITGIIHSIDETEVRGEYHSRKFVIKVEDGDYPQHVPFEISHKADSEYDNCKNLGEYNKVGDTVDVEANISGRLWNAPAKDGKPAREVCFLNLKAWKVSKSNGTTAAPAMEEEADCPF